MKKTFNNILFDWDGCIVNTLPVWVKAMRLALPKYTANPSEDLFLIALANMDEMTNHGVQDIHRLRNEVYTYFNENISDITFCDDVETTLSQIHKTSKKTALVSNSHNLSLQKILKQLETAHVFDAIITGDDVTFRKPHPEPVLKAMHILRANTDNTIIIGDSSVDIQAGKAAGITTVLYHSEDNKKIHTNIDIKKLQPDFVIENMQELLNIVQ